MSGTRPLSVLLAGMTVLALVGMLTLVGLVIADWREFRHEQPTLIRQVADAVNRGDHLHYVVHLVQGRVADLCPCTRWYAEDQYARAVSHVRTERQRELVTTERPTTPMARVIDALGILDSGLHWADAAGTWTVKRTVS
jgi:hypothetical protein